MITDKGMHEIKKTNTRQEVERILPAEIFANHLQAGYSALHAVILIYYWKFHNLFISSVAAPFP